MRIMMWWGVQTNNPFGGQKDDLWKEDYTRMVSGWDLILQTDKDAWLERDDR